MKNIELSKRKKRYPPTDKQVNFAKAIASELDINILALNLTTFDDFHTFISEHRSAFDKLSTLRNEHTRKNAEMAFTEFFIDIDWLIENLSGKSGLYAFFCGNDIAYIGKSVNLAERIPSSYSERKNSTTLQNMGIKINEIMYFIVNCKPDMDVLEILLINENKPLLNRDCRRYEPSTLFKSNINVRRDFMKVKRLKA